ncbi:thiamine phosphate synthase [Altericroceibacterium endophyticum]|uniref:Thiamine phosphate synthase n=1 Tax=Altericroceibacterium endophyticum TaxID=1808508 RepID=A0A6I4T7A7_9SPHN|nr:thiamine phosphate synthase [Altericroceibacterium endophyticum]MXO65853.1 thiamine phosphate synthase [Altericroceibacterium endophyticum]
MAHFQTRPCDTLPRLWLISDARNDRQLENALQRLPRGSGFIYRHYHLSHRERAARFAALLRQAKSANHVVVLADDAATARQWGADGVYGRAALHPAPGLLRLSTAHSPAEIAQANRARADMALISPIFPTHSHPGAPHLGPMRFQALAALATMPVIALGGMNPRNARRLRINHWAAIDGLTP